MLLVTSATPHVNNTPACRGPLGRPRLETIRVLGGEPQKHRETSRIFQRGCAEGRVLWRARRSQPFPSDTPFRLYEYDGGKKARLDGFIPFTRNVVY